jgi:hypothetical protein
MSCLQVIVAVKLDADFVAGLHKSLQWKADEVLREDVSGVYEVCIWQQPLTMFNNPSTGLCASIPLVHMHAAMTACAGGVRNFEGWLSDHWRCQYVPPHNAAPAGHHLANVPFLGRGNMADPHAGDHCVIITIISKRFRHYILRAANPPQPAAFCATSSHHCDMQHQNANLPAHFLQAALASSTLEACKDLRRLNLLASPAADLIENLRRCNLTVAFNELLLTPVSKAPLPQLLRVHTSW